MSGVSDDSDLHRLRQFLDRADNTFAHESWAGPHPSPRLIALIDESRAIVDRAETATSTSLLTEIEHRVEQAEASIARVVLARAQALDPKSLRQPTASRRELLVVAGDVARTLVRLPWMVGAEIRHVFTNRPYPVLTRLALTLGISLGVVTFLHTVGAASHNAGTLTVYLFSAVVGSIVCTNALCFDAARVHRALDEQVPLWRILIVKNITMALLVLGAAVPVLGYLSAGNDDVNALVVLDQIVAMLFIWLGVGNVLSVLSPLRHEPISARLHDGTWLPYLLSFVISYGMGLTVNLMIYWRLWARQAAAEEITGGAWSAFLLVLISSALSWVLLTVVATTLAHHPVLRRILIREMR